MNQVYIDNITIPLNPCTKKNHSQILTNPSTGKPFLMPSSQYIKYEKSCLPYLIGKKAIGKPPFNLKAVFYMQTKRKVDLSNLLGAICDILVKYKVIEDDNCNVLSSFDGSKVLYDKENPRTEIYIQTLGWQK